MMILHGSKCENTPSFQRILELLEIRQQQVDVEGVRSQPEFEKNLHTAVGEFERELLG